MSDASPAEVGRPLRREHEGRGRAPSRSAAVRIVGWGLLAFALLTVRFSPNWVMFYQGVREAYERAQSTEERAAVEKAVLSGHSERGWHVLRQTRDLAVIVDDPNHKIVRWRLLPPVVGKVLRLPDWATLGLAHVGCALWLTWMYAIFRRAGLPEEDRPWDGFFTVLIIGATAPFFASMGWLGYYDSWLVLALLAVAHGQSRWLVGLACVLGPWVDERFVLGLPLALLVRWILAEPAPSEWRTWLKAEAIIPLVLTAGYGVVRLALGGHGGSQTVAEYFRQFVITPQISLAQRLDGAWSGLRFGWILVALALISTASRSKRRGGRAGWLLAAGVVLTGGIGLLTALDMGRSMALLIPVVTLGAVLAMRTAWWSRWKLSPVMAGLAIVVPATHVFGLLSLRVDSFFAPSLPMHTAQNNLGTIYFEGNGVPRDLAVAEKIFRQAIANGSIDARVNFANLLAAQPGRQEDAIAYYESAIRSAPDDFLAHQNLAVLLAKLPGRQADALAHYDKALRIKPDCAEAHFKTANLLARITDRQAAALAHYESAVRFKPDYADAHSNLGALLASMPGRRSDAVRHFQSALQLKPDLAEAHCNLADLLAESPEGQGEALQHYDTALRIKPDYGDAHNNLANLLATIPSRQVDALIHYEKAAQLTPDSAAVHYNFATLLEKSPGRKSEARSHYLRALSIDPGLALAKSALDRLDRAEP